MARTITHVYLDKTFPPSGGYSRQECKFFIKRPGKLQIFVDAFIRVTLSTNQDSFGDPNRMPDDTAGVPKFSVPQNLHEFSWTLSDPNGEVFNKDYITLTDLDKYRSLRGKLDKEWTLKINENYPNRQGKFSGKTIEFGEQTVKVKVEETLSSSAPPLIDDETSLLAGKTYSFDLYRLGKFMVKTRILSHQQIRAGFVTSEDQEKTGQPAFDPALIPDVTLSLINPDGITVEQRKNVLEPQITPTDLKLSRGPDGVKREWKLHAVSSNNSKYRITANVIDKFIISPQTLIERLRFLFDPESKNLTIKGNWNNDLQTNVVTASFHNNQVLETLDNLGALDAIKKYNLARDIEHPKLDTDYVLTEIKLTKPDSFWGIDVTTEPKILSLKTEKFTVEVGKTQERRAMVLVDIPGSGNPPRREWKPIGEIILPASLLGISINIETSGTIRLEINNSDNAEIAVNGLIEIGLEVRDGRVVSRIWVDPNFVKYAGKEGSPHIPEFMKDVKQIVTDTILDKLNALNDVIQDGFDNVLGGVFEFVSSQWSNDVNNYEFSYITGNEHEHRPTPGYIPFGWSGMENRANFLDKAMNAWKPSPNLSKIDHIVVLIMENRSFDHVLGYLSAGTKPKNPNVNGLTGAVIQAFSTDEHKILPLSQAGFAANATKLKTKLPLHVGHEYEHVAEQLAYDRDGKPTMKGFVDNFKKVNGSREFDETGCKPQDVLGYYTDTDLEMYGELAKNFAICDNYFCSHPGPTLPNRMYSLTGNIQYDDNGEPRLDNGTDSPFFFSRNQTIFDLLNQYQVSWRVYESSPSATMLRLFSRYAGNNNEIRDITLLKADIAKNDLPSVTFIDPAMHHSAPQNDDHPPVDMYDGQRLIKDLYQTLSSNPEIWNKTLFIITYDEHGGLFDHEPPQIAEVLTEPHKLRRANSDASAATHTEASPAQAAAAPSSSAQPAKPQASAARSSGALGISASGAIFGKGLKNPKSQPAQPARPVPPPQPKANAPIRSAGRVSGDRPDETIRFGVRVPTFLVSPWVEPGYIDKTLLDHTSILKTILLRFCGEHRPFLSDRVHYANHLGSALTLSQPRVITIELPDLPEIEIRDHRHDTASARPVIAKADLKKENADWHDYVEVLSTLTKPF